MASRVVILDTFVAVRAFRIGLSRLPFEQQGNIEHYLAELFTYLHDQHDYSIYLEAYLDTLDQQLAGYPVHLVQELKRLLAQLCEELHRELVRAQLWDDKGALWYAFDSLLGNDVVMRSVTLDHCQ